MIRNAAISASPVTQFRSTRSTIAAGSGSTGSTTGHSRARASVHHRVLRSDANHVRHRPIVRRGGDDIAVVTRHAASTTVMAT